MRLNLGHSLKPASGHAPAKAPRNRHRLEKFEGAADLMVVGIVILLGLAMIVGLLTASGTSNW